MSENVAEEKTENQGTPENPETSKKKESAESTEKTETKELSGKLEDIAKQVEGLTALELSELVKGLEDRLGIQAAAPMVAGAFMPGAGGGGEAAQEEKTSFDVVLAEIGGNKISVIKEVRAATNLGLKEAKDLVEAAPKAVKQDATKEEAEELKKKLEGVGAKVEIK